jgi:hypothetical protein
MARKPSMGGAGNRLISGDIPLCDIIVPVVPQLLHGRFA